MRIKTKFIFVLIIFFFILFLLISIAIAMSQWFITTEIGKSSIYLAEEMAMRVQQILYMRFEDLQSYTYDKFLHNALYVSNKEFNEFENIPEVLNQRNSIWQKNQDEIFADRPYINNDISKLIYERFIQFYNDKYLDYIFINITIMNKYGAVIATTMNSGDYSYSDTEWWQNALHQHIYIGSIEQDSCAGLFCIPYILKIEDINGRFIGMLRAHININAILSHKGIFFQRFETTHTEFVTEAGKLIYSTRPFVFYEEMNEKLYYKKINGDNGFYIAKRGNENFLYSFAKINDYRDFPAIGWIVIVGHQVNEILRPVYTLHFLLISLGIISFLIYVIIGVVLIRTIINPLRKLEESIKIIGDGNLDYRIKSCAKDETGMISNALDMMLDNIQQITTSRDKLNEEITARIKTENYLKKMTEKLTAANLHLSKILKKNKESQSQLIQAEKMGALGVLTAGVAHEMNNPLMSILNFLQYCNKHVDNEKITNILQDAEKEVQKCIKIVKSLLTYSRMEAEFQYNFQNKNIYDILKQVIKLVSYKSEVKNILIELNNNAENSFTYIMENSISQVFFNILLNAVYAVKNQEIKEITITIKQSKSSLFIFFSDTGPGIPENQINKIFDPFFTTKPPGKGTGLGLSISQDIIEAHSGSLTCKSEIGKGTCFIVELPSYNHN